jgi:hypothetical protein
MGHIDSLTVMSADGASDIVRNATRAMIESTTAIKGLTGLDVPNLIGGALGRGFGERLRTGDGDAGSDTGSAADRISAIAGEGLSTLKAARAEAAAKAEAAAHEAQAKATADAEKVADEAAKAAAVAEALKAAGAQKTAAAPKPAGPADKLTPQPWAAVPQTKPGAPAATAGPAEGNAAQWAKWLAQQLKQIPQIQLFGSITLDQLAERGPAQAQMVWHTAENVLGKDYGKMTVAELLQRFGA